MVEKDDRKLGTKEFKIPFFDLFAHMQKYVYIAYIAHYIICAIYCIYMQKCVFNMCIFIIYSCMYLYSAYICKNLKRYRHVTRTISGG